MGLQVYDESVGDRKVIPTEPNSEIVATKYTLVDQIRLGQRLIEIMKEKGNAYSNKMLALRTGIGSDETIRRILTGSQNRQIYKFELEKILDVLDISFERVIQGDIVNQRKEFREAAPMFRLPQGIALGRAFELCCDWLFRKMPFLE